MEYYELEPFGTPAADMLNAFSLTVHANMRRRAEQEPLPLHSFLMFNRQPERDENKPEPLVDGLTAAQWRQRIALEQIAAARQPQ